MVKTIEKDVNEIFNLLAGTQMRITTKTEKYLGFFHSIYLDKIEQIGSITLSPTESGIKTKDHNAYKKYPVIMFNVCNNKISGIDKIQILD